MDTVPVTLRKRREMAGRARTLVARRRLLEDGVMFARFTIQEKTSRAERMFAYWKSAGRPSSFAEFPAGARPQYVKQAERCLADVRALTPEQVNTLWAGAPLDPWGAVALLRELIHGLGWPKACFALACAGIGHLGCVDSHVVRAHFDLLRPILSPRAIRERSSTDWTLKRYRAVVETLWGSGDSAAAQWAEWLTSYVTDTTHSVLLED